MAPIKFEENIKGKLEKRTLSPSTEAWSKLSDRLDEDDKKSKRPIYWWLGIAASLLIMMAIAVQFFNSNTSEKILPQVVDKELIDEQLNIETPEINEEIIIELAIEYENTTIEKEQLPKVEKPQIIDPKKGINNKKTEPKVELANQIKSNAIDSGVKKETMLNNEVDRLLNDALIKSAVADALDNIKSQNPSVTDREIDSLLKVASKELFKENLNKEIIKITDSEALLNSVEEEMGQSFRTKVFEALKESYNTVRTAVADRNN